MKLFRPLMALAIASFVASPAKAAIVNYTEGLNTVALVSGVQTVGTYNFSGDKGLLEVFGNLSPDTKITFTYTYAPTKSSPHNFDNSVDLSSSASYKYKSGGKTYSGSASAETSGAGSSGTSTSKGSAKPLVFVDANIVSPTVGTTTIINYAAAPASFISSIDVFKKLFGKITLTYVISSVPLPASLPMFGAALIALVAVGARRKAGSFIG